MNFAFLRGGKRKPFRLTSSPPVSPPPILQASSTAFTIVAVSGNPAGSGLPITIFNSGGQTLTGVSVVSISGSSWLTPSLSGSGNDYVLSFTNSVHTNAIGSAQAVVRVSCTNPGVAPVDISITGTTIAAPSGVTTIDVELARKDGITSVSKFYGNIPLPRGLVFPTDITNRLVSLFIGGVEQAIYCEGVKYATHYDGSFRAIHIQLDIAHAGTNVSGQVVIGNVRTTTDITTRAPTTWTDLFSGSGTTLALRTAILPTDPNYLCTTRLAFCSMLPYAQENALEQAWTNKLKSWLNANRSLDLGASTSQSSYDLGIACWGYWMKTGDQVEFFEGIRRVAWYLDYTIGSPTATEFNPRMNVYGDTVFAGSDTMAAEWHSQRFFSYAAFYLLTSYAPAYAAVNANAQNHDKATKAFATAATGNNGYISAGGLPRFNLVSIHALMTAYVLDANRKMANSGYGNRFRVWETEYIWVYDAIEARRQITSGHKNGITGHSVTVPPFKEADGSTRLGWVAGDGVHFQTGLFTAWMIRSMDECLGDSRLDAFIKTNVTKMLENMTPGGTSGFRNSYAYNDTQGPDTDTTQYHGDFGGGTSYQYNHYATAVAYCKAKWPTESVNGRTFSEWYDEMIRTSCLSSLGNGSWKLIGEYFGYGLDASYYAHGNLPQTPPSLRPSVNPTSWPP